MASAMTITIIPMIIRRGSMVPKIPPSTFNDVLSSLLSSSAVLVLPGSNKKR